MEKPLTLGGLQQMLLQQKHAQAESMQLSNKARFHSTALPAKPCCGSRGRSGTFFNVVMRRDLGSKGSKLGSDHVFRSPASHRMLDLPQSGTARFVPSKVLIGACSR